MNYMGHTSKRHIDISLNYFERAKHKLCFCHLMVQSDSKLETLLESTLETPFLISMYLGGPYPKIYLFFLKLIQEPPPVNSARTRLN